MACAYPRDAALAAASLLTWLPCTSAAAAASAGGTYRGEAGQVKVCRLPSPAARTS
jgi:hypothetical protein